MVMAKRKVLKHNGLYGLVLTKSELLFVGTLLGRTNGATFPSGLYNSICEEVGTSNIIDLHRDLDNASFRFKKDEVRAEFLSRVKEETADAFGSEE